MIKFEKISYKQFAEDSIKNGYSPTLEIYNNIKIPVRGTEGSAGYDFVAPYDYKFKTAMPTGIRIILPNNLVLIALPRSGIGFKSGISLANTAGIIDSDYQVSDNEGHIMVKFVEGFKDYSINAGERMMQGIILNYYTTDDDKVKISRNGGFGSTGK